MQHELLDRADEWNLFEAAVLAMAWRPESLASRAVAEADGEGFEELSMVVGLLAWLAWDVDAHISVASQRGELEGFEDDRWYEIQLLASIGPWLVGDASAQKFLEESVSRTTRFGVDGERWVRMHLAALDTFTIVSASPDELGKLGCDIDSGDLVLLHPNESPRVRVVLDVVKGSEGGMVYVFDPDARDGTRTFLASRVPAFQWASQKGLPRFLFPSAVVREVAKSA